MQMPENYLAKAEQCLRDAADAPESLRLQFILMAQRWFELAEFFAPFEHVEDRRGERADDVHIGTGPRLNL